MVSETAAKGTIPSFSRTFIKWHAARDKEGDVTAREALCHTDTQDGKSVRCFADSWIARLSALATKTKIVE